MQHPDTRIRARLPPQGTLATSLCSKRVAPSPVVTQEWLPDLDARVEAQFDTLNKKKDWYEGVVTQVNGDDTMTVLFKTNVSEQNVHPDKVRLLGGKPPKVRRLVQPGADLVARTPGAHFVHIAQISKRYRGVPAASVEGFNVGEAVEAPFEGNIKKLHDGTIVKTNKADGTCDVCFRFNPNVIEHGIPVGKLERKLTMDPALASMKKALDKIMKHQDSRHFLKPVMALWPPEAIPNYADIVKRPMVRLISILNISRQAPLANINDWNCCVQTICASSQDLGTVKTNLTRGLYNGKPQEMIADVELVFQNCQTYTGFDKASE